MRALAKINYNSGDLRTTRRVVGGVRIVEKESHSVIKLVGGSYVDARKSTAPRLVVVDDEGANPSSFITKDRRSIAGLDSILQNAIG